MHPRTQTKREIKRLLESIGVPVHVSQIDDLHPDEDKAIIVYVTDESLSRRKDTGEGSGVMPVVRTMTVVINVLTRSSGTGEEATERGDDLSRAVELAIHQYDADLIPTSVTQGLSNGASKQILTTLTYTTEYLDKMEP